VILLQGGTGRSGRRAAASHTGALAEKAGFLADLCAQYGVLLASGLEEMFDLAAYLSEQPLPKGPRLGIVTNAGGPAILAADEAERQGLVLPEPSPALRAALAAALPPAAGLRNPVDVLGDSDAARYRHALDTLAASGEYDALLAICTPQRMTPMAGIAGAVAAAAPGAAASGTALASSLAAHGEGPAVESVLAQARVPAYAFAEEAARSLGAAWRLSRWASAERRFPAPTGARPAAAAAVVDGARREGRSRLTGPEAEAVLKAYGIPVVPCEIAASREDLRKAARAVGFPLAAKIVSPDILHKVDAGGVRTGISGEEELEEAFGQLMGNAKRYRPDADIRGVQLQPMIGGGVEFLIGAHRHPQFGVLLLFGLGGTWVEVLADARVRRAPLCTRDAEEMIRGIRAASLLGPFRGRPARDVGALEDCLFRLERLMADQPDVVEVDLNPVFSLPDGALVADARMVLSG
jgi:acetyltransferase